MVLGLSGPLGGCEEDTTLLLGNRRVCPLSQDSAHSRKLVGPLSFAERTLIQKNHVMICIQAPSELNEVGKNQATQPSIQYHSFVQ